MASKGHEAGPEFRIMGRTFPNVAKMLGLLWGEFRISIPRTLAARPFLRVFISTRFKVRGKSHIEVGPGSRLHLGTTFFGFVDGRERSLLRVRGRLIIKGSVRVGRGARWDIGEKSKVEIGDGTYFSPNTKLISTEAIIIGARCAIGWGTSILDSDFHTAETLDVVGSRLERVPDRTLSGAVRLADHVWLGSDVKVLKGVSIAAGCIVAAGSVVTRDVTQENVLVGGIPARLLKEGVTWR